jgi:hypothetical protein
MRVLGHIWTVVTNLAAIVIVLGMFSVASTRFETVVIVALTLIYFEIIASTAVLARQGIESRQTSFALFIGSAENSGDPKVAEYTATLNEAIANYQKLNVQYYINVVFRIVIWLIAVWKLLAVTVFGSN